LTDATLDFTNLPTVVLITQQYGSSFQIKLRAFVSSYLKLFRTVQALQYDLETSPTSTARQGHCHLLNQQCLRQFRFV
jgi:hypothetical protein